MANKIVQLTDNGDNLYPLSVIQANAVEEASAAWTGTNVTGSNNVCTGTITVTKGFWLVEVRIPWTDTTTQVDTMFELKCTSGTTNISASSSVVNAFAMMARDMRATYTVKVTSATATLRLTQVTSGERVYSLLDRGGLYAIKIDPCNVATTASTVTDISNQFTYKLSNGTGTVLAYYDSASGRVWGSISVSNATTVFDTSTAMYQVASAYRPSANVIFPMMIHNSSGWNAYRGVLGTSGNITQGLTSTADSVYGNFEYYIS